MLPPFQDSCPEFYQHKKGFITLKIIKDTSKIKLLKIIQNPGIFFGIIYINKNKLGEFLVIFPRVFHMSVSSSFNISETIKFATSLWIMSYTNKSKILFISKITLCKMVQNLLHVANALELPFHLIKPIKKKYKKNVFEIIINISNSFRFQ